jgi:hypothetical protein
VTDEVAADALPITAGAAKRIEDLLRTGRHAVAMILVGFLILALGVWSGFQRIDRESKARQADNCQVSLRARHELVAGLTEFGRQRHADPQTIAALRDVYANLPPPAGC